MQLSNERTIPAKPSSGPSLKDLGRNATVSFECANCAAAIAIPRDVIVGEIVNCKDCGSNFEATEIREDGTVKFKDAETPAEDWGE